MSDEILVGTRKGLFSIVRRSGRWQIGGTAFLGDNVSMLLADPRDGVRYVALEHGHFGCKMHRSAGARADWSEIAAPAYPPKPDAAPEVDPMGKTVPWTVLKIWSLEAGGAGEPGVLWCGTIPGGLFKSSDGGASWSLNAPLWNEPRRKKWFGGGADFAGIHSIAVDPRDHRVVRIGVSCGGVWRTTDGGASWDCTADGMKAAYMPPGVANEPAVQDAHRLVQAPSAPDRLWVQHHDTIYRSDDAGGRWHDIGKIEPSAFGFAVAVHPADPDCAWFVPAVKDEKRYPVDGRLVVTRTRDGGRSFDILRQGLPQAHAYDLIYRHGLDVDAAGKCLVIGSTTGGLFVSEDQGESWQLVSAHLPPIHCVRFVH